MYVYLINHAYNREHLSDLGLRIITSSMYPFIRLIILNNGFTYSYAESMPDELEPVPMRIMYEVQLLPTMEAKELYLRSQGDFIK